mmetsp:Transcript_3861/g.15322  ORF Transcript_3861/g.15322 Transcript_3861/m.15322 type:complete len:394 (-) Transcript_3861:2829-4010(-)
MEWCGTCAERREGPRPGREKHSEQRRGPLLLVALGVGVESRGVDLFGVFGDELTFLLVDDAADARQELDRLGALVLSEPELPADGVDGERGAVGLDDLGGRVEADAVDEHVEDVLAHVGRVGVEREERRVVAQVERGSDLERVRDGGVGPRRRGHVAHDAQQLGARRGAALRSRRGARGEVEVVEDAIREELAVVLRRGRVVAERRVQLLELRLALVVLVHVGVLERDARVRLVHVDREARLDALHRQVLPDRLELVARPLVIHRVVAPFLLELREGRREHALGPHRRRIGRRRQSKVVLLERLGRAEDRLGRRPVGLVGRRRRRVVEPAPRGAAAAATTRVTARLAASLLLEVVASRVGRRPLGAGGFPRRVEPPRARLALALLLARDLLRS